MKFKIIYLIIILAAFSCGPSDVWWNGDVDLGDDYYYMVEPEFNSIQSLNSNDPNRGNGYVLRNVEYIGFNKDYILAINKNTLNYEYWIIDKNQKSKFPQKVVSQEATNKELIGPIDSLQFAKFKIEQKIEMLSKTDYRKKLNYE